MHPELLFELINIMPPEVVKVAESGLTNADEIAKLRDAGYDAFLMGEASACASPILGLRSPRCSIVNMRRERSDDPGKDLRQYHS